MRVSVSPLGSDAIRIVMIPSDASEQPSRKCDWCAREMGWRERCRHLPSPRREALGLHSPGTLLIHLMLTLLSAVPLKMALVDEDWLPKAILSSAQPHVVQSVSSSFTELYGIYAPQIIGRSLHLIHGPRTDMRVWNAMVNGALLGEAQCDTIYTCACDCTEFVVDVTITPASSSEGLITHLVCTFSVPSTIPQNKLMYQGQSCVPESEVYRGNDMYNNADMYKSENSYGSRPEADIYSQQQFDYSSPPSRHQEQQQQHQQQQKQCQQQKQQQSQQHYPMMPVQEEPDINHQPQRCIWAEGERSSSQKQLVSLSPVSQHSMITTQRPPPQEASGRSSASSSYAPATESFRSLCVSEGESSSWGGSLRSKQADSMGPLKSSEGTPLDEIASHTEEVSGDGTFSAIFPRRKVGESKMDTRGPVLITLDVLKSMADVPLSDAARQLGVSSTAIKKACRKIGVQRWPYRKRAEGAQQADLLSDYNEAYVRKLFRKYSPKVPKAVKSKVTKGESKVVKGQGITKPSSGRATHVSSPGGGSGDESCDESSRNTSGLDVNVVGAKLRGIQMQDGGGAAGDDEDTYGDPGMNLGINSYQLNEDYAAQRTHSHAYQRESYNTREHDWSKNMPGMDGTMMPWLMASAEGQGLNMSGLDCEGHMLPLDAEHMNASQSGMEGGWYIHVSGRLDNSA